MTKCVLCDRRIWFWQAGIASRFGFGHIECIDRKIRDEVFLTLYSALIAVAAAGLATVLKLRSGVDEERTQSEKNSRGEENRGQTVSQPFPCRPHKKGAFPNE
jgi:hypothetical protein